jgi:hypothetical protein
MYTNHQNCVATRTQPEAAQSFRREKLNFVLIAGTQPEAAHLT